MNDTDSQIVLRQGHVLGYAVTCDVTMDDCDNDWPTVREVNSVSLDELPEHLQGLYQRSVDTAGSWKTENFVTGISRYFL